LSLPVVVPEPIARLPTAVLFKPVDIFLPACDPIIVLYPSPAPPLKFSKAK